MAQTTSFDEAAALAIVRQTAEQILTGVSLAKAIPRTEAAVRWTRRQHELAAAEVLAAKAGHDIAQMLLELAKPLRSE